MKDCDVVIYQAGTDPCRRDPLGGQLSLVQLGERESRVFNDLKNVAWNLAGGYSEFTDRIHLTTLNTAYRSNK